MAAETLIDGDVGCDIRQAPTLQNGYLLFEDSKGAYAIFRCHTGFTFYSDTAGVLWCNKTINEWLPHQSTCYVDNSTLTQAPPPDSVTTAVPVTSFTTPEICTNCDQDTFQASNVAAVLPGSTAALIVVAVVAAVLLLFVAAMFFLINRRRREWKALKGDDLLSGGTASGRRNRLAAWLASLPSAPSGSSTISEHSQDAPPSRSNIRSETSARPPAIQVLRNHVGNTHTSVYLDGQTVTDSTDEVWQGDASDKLKLLKSGKTAREAPDGGSQTGKASVNSKSVNSAKLDHHLKINAISYPKPGSPVSSSEYLQPGIPQPYDIEAPPSLASSFQDFGPVIYPDLDDIHFQRATMINVNTGRESFRHVTNT